MIKGCVLDAPPGLFGSDSDREINVLKAAIQSVVVLWMHIHDL